MAKSFQLVTMEVVQAHIFNLYSCEDKKQYTAKISLIDRIDPYTLNNYDLSDDAVLLPPLR